MPRVIACFGSTSLCLLSGWKNFGTTSSQATPNGEQRRSRYVQPVPPRFAGVVAGSQVFEERLARFGLRRMGEPGLATTSGSQPGGSTGSRDGSA
jgi:hypothetical protein